MASLFDRILRRPPRVDKPAHSDSGRHHTSGFLDEDELNSELRGKTGIKTYNKMFRGDHDVRRNVMMVVYAIACATWSFEPHGGNEASDEDRQIADDLEWALGLGTYEANTPLRIPWANHLLEFLPVLIRAGYTPGEFTWTAAKRDGRDLVTLRNIGLRLPTSIERWITDPRDLKAARENPAASGAGARPGDPPGDELLGLVQFRSSTGEHVLIEREDLVYYRVGAEGDNWEGISMLRPAYKAWYLKDKLERLDAIGHEREAVGIPVVYPPESKAKDQDILTDLERKLTLLRAGELAYLIMPGPDAATVDDGTGWTFKIMGLGGEGGGGKRDANPSIERWRDAISAAFIEEFMRLGQGGEGAKGALATAKVQDDPFSAALQALAKIPATEITQLFARRFVNLNYGEDKPLPQLTMSLTEDDLEGLVTFVSGLVTAGALYPDEPLEDFLRQRGKLPPADPAAREERKLQEEEARQAEIDGMRNPAVGNDEETVVEKRSEKKGPDGSRTVSRETQRKKSQAKALDDGPGGFAKSNPAVQITVPMVGDQKPERDCEECGHRHGGDCDDHKTLDMADVVRRRMERARPFERLMPIAQLAEVLDHGEIMFVEAAQPHVTALAAQLAQDAGRGRQGPQTPPDALVDHLAASLAWAEAGGSVSVPAELDAQRTQQPATLDMGLVVTLAAQEPHDSLSKRARLAARAIVQAISHAIGGRHIDGVTDPALLQAAGEQAGLGAAKTAAASNIPGALNHGREQAARDHSAQIRGARYTSILDRSRCETCAMADDGVLRTLDDPVRVARKPPNAQCRSTLGGHNRCRCMEFYELDDEAPSYLDDEGDERPFVLFDPAQPRDPDGKWVRLPHPASLALKGKLGGGTGAQLREDQAGNRYVTKKGGHSRHLLEEDAADQVYRAAGASVPDSQVHATPAGPVKVARYLEKAKPLHELRGRDRRRAHEQLREHFALDALLANWDVVGLGHDNAMVAGGKTYRIDNGGALRFRAHGQPKTQVAAYPTELWTMREHGPASAVYGDLSWSTIVDQARKLLEQRQQLLAALPGSGQRAFLQTRLRGLETVIRLHDEGKSEHAIRAAVGGGSAAGMTLGDYSADYSGPPDLLALVDEDDDAVYTLAKAAWNPADHPRDDDGRFKVKIGGIPLQVVEQLAGKHSGNPDDDAPSRAVEKALKYKGTSTHVMKKGGVEYPVVQHQVAAHSEGLDDLEAIIKAALDEKAYKTAPNSSAAKQGLEKALANVQQAQAAAIHHQAKAKPKPEPAPAPDLDALQKAADEAAAAIENAPKPKTKTKGIKGPQLLGGLEGAKTFYDGKTKIQALALDLAPGDVVQKNKGGNKLELVEQTSYGWKAKKSNGAVAAIHDHAWLHSVTKADGSEVKLADPNAPGPAAAAPKLTAAQLAAKLDTDGVPAKPFGQLPKGTVFKDLQGNLAVLDPDTGAFEGYITGHVIDGPKKGGKIEVPTGKSPAKVLGPNQAAGALDLVTPGNAGPSPTPAAAAKKKGGMYGGNEPPAKFDGVPTGSQAQSLFEKWQAGNKTALDGPEKSAVKAYTNGDYGNINGQLRDSESPGTVATAQKAARLDSAIAKAGPTQQPVVLSRKTTLPSWQAAQPGQAIQDNGFLSSSVSGGTWNGNIHLKILLPAGAHGLWVNNTGASSHPGEEEVILPRGSQFVVLDRQESGGTTVLYVELIV